MNKAYDDELIETAKEVSTDLGMKKETHTGVLICLGGPNYETVAELRMWKILGVDSVGMSIVIKSSIIRNFDLNSETFHRFTKQSPRGIAT